MAKVPINKDAYNKALNIQEDPIVPERKKGINKEAYDKVVNNSGTSGVQEHNLPIKEYTDYIENVYPDQDINEQRALGQSNWEKLGHGLVKTGNELVVGTVKAITDIPDNLRTIYDDTSIVEKDFSNHLSEWLGSLKENVDESNPIYTPKTEEGFSPTSVSWWTENMSSIASAATFIIPALAGAKVAQAGVAGINALGRASKRIPILKNILIGNKANRALQGLTGTIYSNLAESMQDAIPLAQQKYQEALDSGLPEEEARQIGAKAGWDVYTGNLPNIVLDLPSTFTMLKGFKSSRDLLKAKTLTNTLKKEVIPEAVQESINYISKEEATRTADISIGKKDDDFSSLTERVINKYMQDPDMWTATFFGGIGGSVFQGVNSIRNKFSDDSKKESALRKLQEQRNTEIAALHNNKELFKEGQDSLLFEEAYNSAKTSSSEIFINKLKEIQAYPDEEATKLGIDKSLIQDKINKALEIEDIYNDVSARYGDSESNIDFNKIITQSIIDKKSKVKDLTTTNSEISSKKGELYHSANQLELSAVALENIDVPFLNDRINELEKQKATNISSLSDIQSDVNLKEEIKKNRYNLRKPIVDRLNKKLDTKVKALKSDLKDTKAKLKEANTNLSKTDEVSSDINLDKYPEFEELKKLNNQRTQLEQAIEVADYFHNLATTKEGRKKLEEDSKSKKDSRQKDINNETNKVTAEKDINKSNQAVKDVKAKKERIETPTEEIPLGETPLKKEVLTNEEVKTLESDLHVNKVNNEDGEFDEITAKDKTLEEENIKTSLLKENLKDESLAPDGRVIGIGNLIGPAHQAIAYLTRNYIATEKTKVYNSSGKIIEEGTKEIKNEDNFLNEGLQDKDLLSHYEYQVGTKITLEVDKTFSITRGDGSTISYQSLRDKEISQGKNNELIPIAVKNTKGKIIGYIHDVDWVTSKNVYDKSNNVEEQREKLKELRDRIVNNSKITTEIISKSYGKLSIFIDDKGKSKKRLVKEALPDPTLRFVIAKKGQLHTGIDRPLILEDEQLINKVDTTYLNGAVYSLLPTPVNGKSLAVRLDTKKLGKEYAESIAWAIEAHYDNRTGVRDEVLKHTGINILTQEGLKQYINLFTYTGSFSKDDVKEAKSSRKFLDVINGKITLSKGKDIIRTITGSETLAKNRKALIEHLEDTYTSLFLSNLEANKPYKISLIKDQEVTNTSYSKYTDFIKEHTETTLNSYKLSDDEYGYFDQPVILFDTNNEVKQEVKTTPSFSLAGTNKEPKPKGIETESGDGEIVIIAPEESDEDESPTITPDKEAIIRQAMENILIPGFTNSKQNEIVDFLAAQVNAVLNNKSKSVDDVFTKWYNKFSENKGNKEIDKILTNWSKFKLLSTNKVFKINNIKLNNELEIEGIEDVDSILAKTNFNDEGTFEIDPKEGVSARLKAFFSFIPTGEKNYLGLPIYLSGDEVMNNVSAILANMGSNYLDMKGRLEELSKSQQWIDELTKKLDKASEQVKNEFTEYASKHYAAMKIVFFKDTKGGMSLRIADSDQNSVSKVIIESWIDNLKQSNLVEESKLIPGELYIPKANRDKLVEEYKLLKEDPTIEGLTSWLNKFGVNLSSEVLKDIKDKSKALFKLTFKELFTDSSGVFKVMNDKLRGSKSEEEVQEDLIYLNNPLDDNSGVRVLARLEAGYTTNKYSNSHKNVENKTVYGYSLNKFFTNKFRELTTNTKLVNDLLDISFSSTSSWLKELQKEGYFKEKFNYFYFDGLKKVKSKQLGVKLKGQSSREHEITKLGLFFNQGTKRDLGNTYDRISHFLFPTMSDKTTMLGITAIAHNTSLNIDGKLGDSSLDALLEIIEGEYRRINKFQNMENKPDIDGYSVGANKFILFPELNSYTSLWAGDKLKPFTTENQRSIKYYLSDLVSNLVSDKKKEWEKLGIYNVKDGKTDTKFIDKSYLYNIVDSKLTSLTNEARINYAANDYVVNYLIANGNAFQMFIGDPALFWKKDMDNTIVNIGKRLAAQIAPGTDIPNSDNDNYRQVLLADAKSVSTNIEYLESLLGKEGAKSYREIEGTDAQEYTTLQEHLYIQKQRGQISVDQYNQFLKDGSSGNLSLRDLSFILQPQKPVYAESVIDKDLDVNRTIYIKSSSFPLISQLTKGLEIDKLRKEMEKKGIARAAFKSATKVGGSDFYTIFNKDGSIKDDLSFDKYLTLPRSGFRIQQEVPFDSEKDKITKGSQETKLLFNNLRSIPEIKELEKLYNYLHHNLYIDSSKELDEELLTNGNLDINKLKDILKKEAIDKNWPLNDIQALDLINNKFRLPLWASSSSNKIESLLNSIVDNKVRKKKMKGFSGVLASEDGFIGKAISNSIVWMNGYNPEEGLKGMREEDGIIKPDQIIAPFKFKDNDGNLLSLDQFIINKEGKKYIDHTKLPKELLEGFGFRIPTQKHSSMSYLQIVGFIPYELGDLTIVPRDFTKRMGSDYDIDKLYIYQYNTSYINGVLSKYSNEIENEKVIQNKLLDIHIAVLSNKDKKVQEQIHTTLDSDELEKLSNKYKDDKTPNTILSDTYQKKKYIGGTEGKMGTATFALDSTFNASIQDLNIYIKDDIGSLIFGEEGNNGKVNEIKGNRLSEENTIDGLVKKSDVISNYLTASVDNERLQILEKINANGFTFDAIRAFNQSGFREEHVVPLLVQPIIKEYVEEMKKAKDTTIEEFIRDPKQTVYNNLSKKYSDKAGISSNLSEEEKLVLNGDYPLTIKEMDKELKDPSPLLQLAILNKFIKARNIGEAIQKIQSAINTDSKGLGKNLFESLYKEQQVRELLSQGNDYIANVSLLIGEIDETTKEIIPTTINGYATVYSLFKNNQLWRKFFPYDNVGVDTVLKEIKAITGKNVLTSEDQKDIWDNIKSYIYTKNVLGLTDLDVSKERKRLLYDIVNTTTDDKGNTIPLEVINKSFATRWKEFKISPKGKKNAFAVRTTTEININTKPSLVKYNAAAGENLDELNVYQAFAEGLLDKSSRELFQDAVLYFYLNGGIQQAVEFGKYIPISYLHAIGFSDNLRDIDFNNEDVLGTFEKNHYYEVSEFTKQFFQNNPYKAPKLKDDLSQLSTKLGNEIIIKADAKDLFVTRFVPEVKKMLDVPVEFITIYDDKKRSNRLYQSIGEFKYKEIPVFTNNFISEYDGNNEIIETSNLEKSKVDNRDKVIKDTESKDYINPSKKEVLLSNYNFSNGELTTNTFKVIVSNSSNMWNSTLAHELIQKFDKLKGIKTEISNGNYKGAFNNETRTLKVNPINIDNKEDLERVILHESIHGLLNDIVTNPSTKEQKEIVSSITRMREGLLDKLKDSKWMNKLNDLSIDIDRLTNHNKEFITLALTDKGFQELLNEIPFSGDKNFFDRLLELVDKMLSSIGFDVNKDSVLAQAIHDILALVDTTEAPILNEEKESKKEVTITPNYLENGTYYQFAIEDSKPVSGLYSQGKPGDWKNITIKKLQGTYDRVTSKGTIVNEQETPAYSDNVIKLPNGKYITLNSEQIDSLKDIKTWLDGNELFYTLSGYAGTGKTTIVKEAINKFKKVAVSAPTHKAKKVISRTTGKEAFTIQSLLGLRPNTDLENFDINNPQFDEKADKKIRSYKLIVIDEASMLNKDLFNLLIKEAKNSNTKLLFMGDPAQLPPVNESLSLVFNSSEIKNKSQLTKVERQAEGNPLMSVYDAIRNDLKSDTDTFEHKTILNALGEGIKFYKGVEKFTTDLLDTFKSVDFQNNSEHAKLLTWTNFSVNHWNKVIRKAIYGEQAKPIEKGELLFAYKSVVGSYGNMIVENSSEYKVNRTKEYTKEGINGYLVDLESIDTGTVSPGVFIITPSPENYSKFTEVFNKKLDRAKKASGHERGAAWREYYSFKEQFLLLEDIKHNGKLVVAKDIDYGYAITIHKSQGSTYNRVFVLENIIDQNSNIEERNKLKYVALSRPTTKAIVLSNKLKAEDNDVLDLSPMIESKLKLRNRDGSRKRFTDYKKAFDKTSSINKTTAYRASLIKVKGEKGDSKLYYAIKVEDEDLSPVIASNSRFQNVIENRELRLINLSKDIAKNLKNREKLGELQDRKKKLESEIKTLETEATLEDVIRLGENDLREVSTILGQDSLSESDLFYSDKILSNLEKYIDYLFTESELELDDEGNHSENVRAVEDLIGKASTLRKNLTDTMQSATLDLVRKVTNNDYKLSDIIIQDEISALSANFLDISRSNNPLLKTLDKLIRDASYSSNRESIKIFDDIDELVEKIKKNPLFKEKGYKLFAQRNSDGSLTGNIVNPYSQEFYNEISKQLRNAKDKGTKQSWEEFFKWKKDNEIVFDVRKLFHSDYAEYGNNSFNDRDKQNHINELIDQLGEVRYKELYSRLEDKIKLYKEDYESAVERYSLEPDAAISASLIDEWVKENSPFHYADLVYEGIKHKVSGRFISPKGYKYLYSAPRKTTLSGEDTKWYDEDFKKIEADKDLYAFHKYMIDTFNKMYDYLPESVTDDLQYNYLPEIKKNILELFNERGMRGGFVGLHDSFMEAISINELPNNQEEKTLPIFMTGNKLTPDEKSYDMGKILKAYSTMVLAYKHKSKVEDPIRLIQKISNDALERQINAAGDQTFDRFGNPISKKGLKNVKDQTDYAVNSFYGDRKILQGVTNKKALTWDEKQRMKAIKGELEIAKQNLESNKITQEEYNNIETPLLEEAQNLGRNIVGSRVGDQVLKYIQLKGMGWNYFGAITNSLYGYISNAIEATGGQHFSIKDFHKATAIMLNSTLKSISGNNYANKAANKINKIMNDYIVISELYEDVNNSSLTNNKSSKGIKQLSPYEAQKRSEYFSQGSTFVALALNTFIDTKDGSKVNLWEAYDENGNWKSDLFSDEVNKSWNGEIDNLEDNKDRNLFKGKLEQLKKSIHGNYDSDSAVRIKSGFWGRSLIQFRSWIAEGVANRFEEEKEDLFLGKRKGRYRTYGVFYKNTDAWSGTIRLFAALITKSGKSKLSEVDKANMRKNAAELITYLSLMTLAILTKKMADDDDDEESQFLSNFLINQALRLQTDITFYTSPIAFEKITRSSIPAFGLVKDMQEFAIAAKKFVEGEDILKTGPYRGTSRVTREGLQLFPLGSQIYGQYSRVAKSND